MFCVFGLYGRFRRQGNLEYEVRVFLKGGRPPPPLQTHPHTHTMREKRRYNGYVFWLLSGGAPASQSARGGGFPKPPSHPAAARRSSKDCSLFLVSTFLDSFLQEHFCRQSTHVRHMFFDKEYPHPLPHGTGSPTSATHGALGVCDQRLLFVVLCAVAAMLANGKFAHTPSAAVFLI